MHGVYLLVILINSLSGVDAIRCYSCDKFDTSEDCMNFTDCGNNEVCYARADGTPLGNVKYTVGCTRAMSALREDYTFCTNVCTEDLCNLNQCNIPLSPKGDKARAPRCLLCELISSPEKCTNLVQCKTNEMCYVREVTVYGNQRFRLGCMDNQFCTKITLPISVNPGTIVGKRSLISDNTSSTDCSGCCDKDHCNTHVCEQNKTAAIGTIYTLKMIGDDICADKNADSCVAFGTLDADACIKLPKVDELCPKTCGICGHFGWEQWGQWSDCSRTCSQGTVTRKRSCFHQVDASLTQNCTGVTTESKNCDVGPCLHEGVWSQWGTWGKCSLTCGNGIKSRVRYCTGHDQIHGGLFCPGDHFETAACNQHPCPFCPFQWIEHGPSCYQFSPDAKTFAEAQSYCHARNSSLLHVQSASENSYIIAYLKRQFSYDVGWWLGMTDGRTEGKWLWTDVNQQVNYTDWQNGQPDNNGIKGDENCAVLLDKFQYKWNDVGCTEEYTVICKI